MTVRLANKTIIITGSCTGIGRAIARRCAQEGANVVVNGLEQELGEQLIKELGPSRSVLFIRDITLPTAPEELINLAESIVW
jgi:NAD(P)-dependent dehydrogenase (short-subunit alcohol dehydrogenase family)